MRFEAPANLADFSNDPYGRIWVQDLERLVREAAKHFDVTVGLAFPNSHVSFTAPVKRRDGTNAVLKVQFPHRECVHEADALRVWAGDGAVQLIDQDPSRHALLLERCVPGTSLRALKCDAALDVYCELLPRLWKATSVPINMLADEAQRWQDGFNAEWEREHRPVPRRWVDIALEACRDLGPSQGEMVLLHQDMHADNVLRAEREPWLVIDPKPLLGEREFSVAPIVRSNELGHTRELVLYRFDRLCSDLGLDRDRARGWTIAQTLAWSMARRYDQHHDTVRWLLGGE